MKHKESKGTIESRIHPKSSILHPKGEANEDGLGDKLRLLHIKPYKIRLHTIWPPTKEALYSSGSLSFHALDSRVLFKVRHKTELGYSEAIRGNEICECMRSQLAGLLNLMVASRTGIWESCGLSAPPLLFGRSIKETSSPYPLR
ncbi:hypothetical protein CDAR_478651 [Caerostris darwini]|uniref:Uncharacterized protein n=1 Tax=Caerostris darwini TaxID=1538125 RepID=A0AAV4QQW5_9ARAC|nr:hypothetical protein CDAR_478651 [Caerostris darwini]